MTIFARGETGKDGRVDGGNGDSGGGGRGDGDESAYGERVH